jgi:hypothetical protein
MTFIASAGNATTVAFAADTLVTDRDGENARTDRKLLGSWVR